MPTVLAFGDSLTWGFRPDGSGRHPKDARWPNVVEGITGFDVINEGLRGRTTAYEEPVSPANLSGAAVLPTILHSHAPLDLVVLMLGTNDIFFGKSPDMAARGLVRLIELVRHHPYRTPCKVPQVMIVAPPIPVLFEDVTQAMIDASKSYRDLVPKIAQANDAGFFDASTVAVSSSLDGVHLDAENTRAIGTAIAPVVRGILSP